MPRREQLIRESFALVAEGGLEALSIRALAQRCRVSIGAVQHHFPTKSRLLMALVDEIGNEITHAVAWNAPSSEPSDPRKRLTALAELLAGAVDDAPPNIKVWLAFLAHGLADESVATRHRNLWLKLEEVLTGYLLAAGLSDQRSRDNAALLMASLDGLALARALEPSRMPIDRCRQLVHQAVEASFT